jgi:ubiquinone/menaquinone biosynthesis C-methylase UbiE
MEPSDVPSKIDLRLPDDAKAWADSALTKRPWRQEFFKAFIDELISLKHSGLTILELGSGPGFLAEQILKAIPNIRYSLLDFSEPMHLLARERLNNYLPQLNFILKDFKRENWIENLGKYDVIVTNQAVHELRHKRYAIEFHKSVKSLLQNQGVYLVCDHYFGDDGMTNNQMYMIVEEQFNALSTAGFSNVKCVLQKNGLVLNRAEL